MRGIVLAWIAVCCCGAALAQTNPLDPAGSAAKEATGQIEGIVVSAKTGEPLKSVRVMYQGNSRRGFRGGAGEGRVTLTGMDGRFAFAGLPAGEYSFYCAKTGYGMRATFDIEQRVQIGDGETRDDVVIRLQPSAVVSGRVLDAHGEPLPGAAVSVMARSYPVGEARWRTMQSDRADDLGTYRLHGLGPGRYVIAAGSPPGLSPRGVSYREFAAAYYPGGDSPEQATPVKLAWGDELTGIDFRLAPAPETTVRGVVIDGATGEPCEECSLFVQTESGQQGFGVAPTREGVFLMRGLPPGQSWVVARQRGPGAGQAAEQVMVPASGAMEVELVVSQGQTLTAEVVLEDPPEPDQNQQAAQQPRRRPRIQVDLQGRGPAMWGRSPRADAPAEGGPVEFRALTPGEYRVRLRAPDGGYLRAISIDGRPLDQPEITMAPGAPLSGLKFHVAYDGATVEGAVKYPAEGEPDRVWILLLPEPGSSTYAERELIAAREGSFRVSGIFPGRYSLYALPRQDAYDMDDAAVLRTLERFARKVTLAAGETVSVELPYIPEPL
ncbi:MAG: carboxypeptidase regulatory-like domain-containing protein [Bryobacterales bacterium]